MEATPGSGARPPAEAPGADPAGEGGGDGPGSGSDDDPFADAVVLAEPTQFTTPSGNISCALDLGYARCDIASAMGAAAPARGLRGRLRVRSEHLDTGDGFVLSRASYELY